MSEHEAERPAPDAPEEESPSVDFLFPDKEGDDSDQDDDSDS